MGTKRYVILFAAVCMAVVTLLSDTVEVAPQSFDAGGWSLDYQFMDVMGSPYLLAHGLGRRVTDATAVAQVPSGGRWRVWVRARNWADGAPGRFQVSVGGTRLERLAALLPLLRAELDEGRSVLVMAPDNLPDFLSKEPEVLRIRIAEDLRIALITNQMAIKDVPEAITKQKIVEKGEIMHTCLRRDLRISSPRIAVLSLNPPTGNETDPWGEEEKEMIIPAIDELAQVNIQAFGPCFADTFFGNGYYTKFDGVLAMYHDQGLAPLKTLAQEESVNLSTGMPFVCTSPEIGVQYDVAGKGCADEAPLRRAIYLGIDVFRNRINYDEPLGNPLPKLYKEKRDDSEKVRFAVPKFKDKEETEKE